MSSVRVLVGTRKGAFILTSDGKREKWEVSSPHFGGWEIYHLKGSPADPNRLYASQTSGWFGQVIQRSSDGGQTWETVGNKFEYAGPTGTHQWYDGTPHPWEFKRVYRSRTGGNEWEALTNGLPQQNCYVNVLRDAMAVDSLDECGIYFGTTGGQVYASADSGDHWSAIVRDLPAVVSVEVQTLS
jgi:photosystem II stability/assembly factor-like uncharacterized protein